MADPSKVRLVRCPKCENILPELEDYSVYQCGGCGAVLRSNYKDREADSVLNRSEEERVGENSSKSEICSSDKEVIDSIEASESDVLSNSSSLNHEEKNPNPNPQSQIDPQTNSKNDATGNDSMPDASGNGPICRGEEPIERRDFGKKTASRNDFEYPRQPSSEMFNDQAVNRDRDELLRKLDELKDQISRSNALDRSKEKFPSSSSLGSNKASMPFSGTGKHPAGPSYNRHYPEPSFPLYTNREVRTCGAFYNPALVHGYGEPVGFQMQRKMPLLIDPYYSGQYVENNRDLFSPYPRNRIFQGRASAPPPPRRFSDVPYNPGVYPHENHGSYGTYNCDSNVCFPPQTSNPCGSQAHGRWMNDVCYETGVDPRLHPPKAALAGGNSHLIRPFDCGAPFVTCRNCFELIQIPENTVLGIKQPGKLRCGACSSVFDLSIVNKRLVLAVHPVAKPVSTEEDYNNGNVHHRANFGFSSDDFDNAGYEFHSVDTKSGRLSNDLDLLSTTPHEMPNLLSSASSAVSGNEHSSESNSLSACSETEKDKENRLTSRQNSFNETFAEATELDVPFDEYANTVHDPVDGIGTGEDDQVKHKKGKESFLVNIVKKSFTDRKKSGRDEDCGKSNVWINGHPVSERLVKKAEKHAGKIKPGNYWYDYRAGFWGVMDGPCLGVIPPYIEELNHPMPKTCSCGNTRVFVNGRELHEKDLELLARRGLPTERERCYVIEISGRVLDEDTCQELDSLGRLAPTVEKLKRGFGMKVPKTAA